MKKPKLVVFDTEDVLSSKAEKNLPLFKSSDMWIFIEKESKFSKTDENVKIITICDIKNCKNKETNRTEINRYNDLVIFLENKTGHECDVKKFKEHLAEFLKNGKDFHFIQFLCNI